MSIDFSRVHELQMKVTDAYDDGNDLDPDDIKSEIKERMSKGGYERYDSGDYRAVYGNGETVAKFAWHRLGIKENKAEKRNWDRLSGRSVKRIDGKGECPATVYLAELLDFDQSEGGWLVMEEVEAALNNVSSDEAEKVHETFEEAGVNIDEIRPYNMGRAYREEIQKEVPVVYDYAGT